MVKRGRCDIRGGASSASHVGREVTERVGRVPLVGHVPYAEVNTHQHRRLQLPCMSRARPKGGADLERLPNCTCYWKGSAKARAGG